MASTPLNNLLTSIVRDSGQLQLAAILASDMTGWPASISTAVFNTYTGSCSVVNVVPSGRG